MKLSVYGALGVAVSSYAVYVKKQKTVLQSEYAAFCDSEVFSCSEVLTSEYSSLLSHWGVVERDSVLDVSNAHLGVVVYMLYMLFPLVQKVVPYHAEFYAVVSCCATIVMLYLAFILAFVLRDFCIVCVATYIITTALLWNSLALLRVKRGWHSLSKNQKSE
ncbi:Vitamin K epoxide reductase complex subunit 1 [Phytophthora citrophthora]|uniref:vitamin-K-epoxide reductase (warfarin-sensitive) n=1 Tax=Phytophthora citrophthora TaxID=4793 RepID=A0AAD9GYL4_9STRA|nr:Vitamin K epoxide reductase complex subunit 1 [Phytophthora citrophthora]